MKNNTFDKSPKRKMDSSQVYDMHGGDNHPSNSTINENDLMSEKRAEVAPYSKD